MKTIATLALSVLLMNTASSSGQSVTDFFSGALLEERWLNIPGGKVADLTNSARFLKSPDQVALRDRFEIPENSGDNYGVRLSGFLRVPEDGDYIFHVSSDDQGFLFLSPDIYLAHKDRKSTRLNSSHRT